MKPVERRIPRALVAAAVAIAFAFPLIPGAAAQQGIDYNSTERTFYFHKMQYCEPQSLIRWMDEFDWGNDLDGCGGDVMDPTTNSWTDTFPTFVEFYANVTTGTQAEFHVFLLSRAVDQTSIDVKFSTGYADCAGSSDQQLLIASQVGDYTEFVVPCTFTVSGAADELAKPTAEIVTTATVSYGMGLEDDHASYVKLTSVEPAPPQVQAEFFEAGARPRATFADQELELEEENATANEAKGNAPSLGLATLFVGVVAVAAAAARASRRE